MEGINGTSCSIFKLYETVIQGEEKETIPKWLGIENIKDRLTQTVNTISSIREESSQLQTSSGALAESIDDFFTKIREDSDDNEDKKKKIQDSSIYLTDPTDTSKKVLPEYYNKYSPLESNGTYLFDISSR